MDKSLLEMHVRHHPFREVPPSKPNAPVDQFLTCPVRLQFSFLDKGRADQQGKLKFDACLIIPSIVSNMDIPKNLYIAAATQKFGANWHTMPLKSPVKDQAKLAGRYPGFETTGKFLQVSSKFQPHAFDQNKLQIPVASLYNGVWVIAWLRTYAYSNNGNSGVGFGVQSLQKLADDEVFPAGDRASAFDTIATHGGNAAANGAAPPAGSGPARAPDPSGF